MGKVVDFEKPPSEPKGARRGRARKRPSKTALVLGGGGFTGGVYEIGALRAIDLLATNSTVNEFDIYVGTSAGAFVSSLLANGVTPGGDDAGPQRRAAVADPRHRPRHAAVAELQAASSRAR